MSSRQNFGFMSAPSWPPWLSGMRRQWEIAHPACALDSCTRRPRLWSHASWRNHSIRLQSLSYCATDCFEKAAQDRFVDACSAGPSPARQAHRIPLGLLLLSRGQLTPAQLQAALEAQRAGEPRRLGEWLIELGFISESQVTAGLGLQWACPVLTSLATPSPGCIRLLPYRLLEYLRMMPVHYAAATQVLHVAFCDGIDHTILYAIERMLDCRTEACLVGRSSMTKALESTASAARPAERMFAGTEDPLEMARITSGYAQQMGAREVRIEGCGDHLWVRLVAETDVANLLFRRRSTAPSLQARVVDGSLPLPLPVPLAKPAGPLFSQPFDEHAAC